MTKKEDYFTFDAYSPDRYLQYLVSIVNGTDLQYTITLFVDGIIISGFLISMERYFAGIKEKLTRQLDMEEDKKQKVIRYLTDQDHIMVDVEAEKDNPFPQCIHMRDVTIMFAKDNLVKSKGLWWRGRIAQVDGFTLGALEFEADEQA